MKNAILAALFLAGALGYGAVAAQTPDYVREQRIADEVAFAVVTGDPVRLEGEDGRSFLGLFTRVPSAKVGIVLVHGTGVHPDWGLIGELRTSLADAGYSTMSIQMPVLAADAKADDYVALYPAAVLRIKAAVQSMRIKGYKKIALVSHSLGSRMSNAYLVKNPESVNAWVAIGMSAELRGVDRFAFPVFDLYGENDLPQVLESATQRGAAIHSLKGSRQIAVPEADHFFNGHYPELDAQVQSFLDQTFR
jgi:pimeloyl-ACP methyl ester carboxylesterase